jgi:tetratricopeptide (TPR) repeat protein
MIWTSAVVFSLITLTALGWARRNRISTYYALVGCRRGWISGLRAKFFARADRGWKNAIAADMAKQLLSERDLLQLADKYPTSPAPLSRWTGVAMGEGDWPEVIRRAAVVRERFPRNIYGYLAGARGLSEAGRFDEADALLEAAMRLMPRQSRVFIDHGMIAHRRRDWPEACRRWAQVEARFPDEPIPGTWHGLALLEMREWDAADAKLGDSCARFPASRDASIFYAEVAHRRGHWQEAAQRWGSVRARFDNCIQGYARGSEALRRAGRIDEARAVVARGATVFPSHPRIQAEKQALLNPGK